MDRRADNMLVGNRGAWLAGHALFSFLSSFSFIFKIVLNWEGIVEGLGLEVRPGRSSSHCSVAISIRLKI